MNQAYFLIIAIFLSTFGTAYTYLSYRNKERLALIDSGLSPDSFKLNGRSNFLLVFGLLFIGFAFGIMFGFFLEDYLLSHYNPTSKGSYPQAYLIMVPFCVGLSLLTAFLIVRKNGK